MDFVTDDNSYRSAQTAADFTGLVQAQLIAEPGVEWVERAQLEKARDEIELSSAKLMEGRSRIQYGKWVKADWMITGEFSLDDRNRRTLFLEITDLQHADVLASQTLVISETNSTIAKVEPTEVSAASGALHQLIIAAHQHEQERSGKILVAPLFFAGASVSMAPDGTGVDETDFNDTLERAIGTNGAVRLIHFSKAYRSTEESEMVLDGMVMADSNAWQQIADLYIWGTYDAPSNSVPGRLVGQQWEITVHVWDGVSQSRSFQERLAKNAPAPEKAAMLDRLVHLTLDGAEKRTVRTDATAIRKDLGRSIVEAYDQMVRSSRRQLSPSGPAIQMLESACFFDPDSARARLLYAVGRWGWYANHTSMGKSRFWSQYRCSEAWRKYVERFGFETEGEKMPFPFEHEGGIRKRYTESIAGLLDLFPQWDSPEAVREDQTRKPGVYNRLEAAEREGFPTEMPSELIIKWKAQLKVEQEKRIAKVAAAAKVNPPLAAPPISLVQPTNKPLPTNRPPAMEFPSRLTFERMNSKKVSTPAWAKEVQRGMFSFSLQDAEPIEVHPEFQEIHFPKQFGVREIIQIGLVKNKLMILAMEQNATQINDVSADFSAERLEKRNRLWVIEPNKSEPVLYEPGLLPTSIESFLLNDQKLWVSGRTTGFLDLTTGKFQKIGLSDGLSLQTSEGLGAAASRIFAIGDRFKLSMSEPQSNSWTDLPLPRVGFRSGTGLQCQIAGTGTLVCYEAGSVLVRDVVDGTWTNLTDMPDVQHLIADDQGFWLGGSGGLHFYDTTSKRTEHWAPFAVQNRITPMTDTGSNQISQSKLDSMDRQIQQTISEVRAGHIQVLSARNAIRTIPNSPRQNRAISGEITALASDGDLLWLGIRKSSKTRLVLMDKRTDSLVAFSLTPGFGNISSLAVSEDSVWVGTEYNDHPLMQIPKNSFLSAKNRWVSLDISKAYRSEFIKTLSVRDQALFAFYTGDDARVVELLGNVNPEKATLEEMFLLAFSCDAAGLNKPELAQAWLGRIISRYPDTPWASAAQKAMDIKYLPVKK